MYDKIKSHPTCLSQYQKKVVDSGQLSQADVDKPASLSKAADDAYNAAPDYVTSGTDWFDSPWKDVNTPNQHSAIRDTGVSMDVLEKVGSKLATVPGVSISTDA